MRTGGKSLLVSAYGNSYITSESLFTSDLNSLAVDAVVPPLPLPFLPWMLPNVSSRHQNCAWDACLAVLFEMMAISDAQRRADKLHLCTRALVACVDSVVTMGGNHAAAGGDEIEGRRHSPWQMEACIHFLAGVPSLISAAVAAGDVNNDKLVAACSVMEEWMCDDAACVALVWLLALPSAGVFFSQM